MSRSLFCAAWLALCLPAALHAQVDSVRVRYAATITQDDLRRHLNVLASDAYEGRETGRKGQKMAAQYLREHFAEFGIPPIAGAEEKGLIKGYEQPFPLELSTPGGLSLLVCGTPIGFMQEFFYLSERLQENLRTETIMLAGYGRRDKEHDDYAGWSAKGQVVMVLQDAVRPVKATDRPSSDFFQELTRKANVAEAAGARVMLLVSPNAREMMTQYAHYITSPRMKLVGSVKPAGKKGPTVQTIIIDQPTAERILKSGGLSWKKTLKKSGKPGTSLACPFEVRYTPHQEMLQGENVLGYIEGSDKKDELVVITAHYDHIGTDAEDVYNGADDDGSGTVAVLEMAQAFAQAKAEGHGPRRSILCMPVSGEEKGLLGSEWYSDHPVFPLDNTVADLNIDMIGRVDSTHTNSPPYVYIIGSDRLSTQLHRINEEANATYTGLVLDNTFNDASDPNRFYYRSDHYNFARYGIPVIFYFSGVHEDYHQPGDEVEKIRFDLLEQRSRLVFHTAWELANREERIVVDKPVPKE